MMTTGRATPAAQKRKTRPTLLPASTAPWTCSFLPLTRHRPTCLCLMISQRVVILCHPSITLHGSRNTQMYQSKVAKTGRPSHNCSPLHTRHPKTTQPSLHSLIQPSTRRVKILSRSQPPVARLLRPDVAPQGSAPAQPCERLVSNNNSSSSSHSSHSSILQITHIAPRLPQAL